MATTTNYGWAYPTVNGDSDAWGGILNTVIIAIDAALKAVSNVANACVTTASLASGIATFLTAPSSANLRAAMTDESGTGALLFAGGALGTPASGVLTSCTGLPNASVVGLGTSATKNLTVSTSAPSGGSAGDVWVKV